MASRAGTDVSGYELNGGTDISVSHTLVAGANRKILLRIPQNGNIATIASVTYGGVTCSAVSGTAAQITNGTFYAAVALYQLDEASLPADGARTAQVNWTAAPSSPHEAWLYVEQWADIKQGAADGTATATATSGTTLTGTLSVAAGNGANVCTTAVANVSGTKSWTFNESQTEVYDNAQSAVAGAAYKQETASQSSYSATSASSMARGALCVAWWGSPVVTGSRTESSAAADTASGTTGTLAATRTESAAAGHSQSATVAASGTATETASAGTAQSAGAILASATESAAAGTTQSATVTAPAASSESSAATGAQSATVGSLAVTLTEATAATATASGIVPLSLTRAESTTSGHAQSVSITAASARTEASSAVAAQSAALGTIAGSRTEAAAAETVQLTSLPPIGAVTMTTPERFQLRASAAGFFVAAPITATRMRGPATHGSRLSVPDQHFRMARP